MAIIKHKRSTTASDVPTTGQLADGELALNTTDGTIHFKNTAGTAVFSFDISADYLPLSGGTLTGNVFHSDNVSNYWGTGNDLRIFHDGNHNYIRAQNVSGSATLGYLYLDQLNEGGLTVYRSANTNNVLQNCAIFGANSTRTYVRLYENSVEKFRTTSTGVLVTGDIAVTGTVDGVDIANLDSRVTTLEGAGGGWGGTTALSVSGLGQLTFEDNNELRFGTAGGESKIYSNATNTFWDTASTAKDIYFRAVTTAEFWFDMSTGNFHADGDVYAFSNSLASDPKLKRNIEPIDNALDKLDELNGVTFNWIRGGKEDAGLISTDVKKVLPQAVKKTKRVSTDEEYESVNYNAVIGLLVNSVKELKGQVKELQERLDDVTK